MDKKQLTREDLYKLVWSEPISTIAKRFKVSDWGLRKICNQMEIPVPKAGHWMKLQFGKEVTITPLREFEGATIISLDPVIKAGSEILNVDSPMKLKVREINNMLGDLLIVPERLSKPDPLIVEFKEYLAQLKESKSPYLMNNHPRLTIYVSEPLIRRAVLFMDTLIKALRARGHNISIKSNTTRFNISGNDYDIQLREKNRRVLKKEPKYDWDRWELQPTGLLIFSISTYYGREWIDGVQKIEKHIASIIAKLELISERENIEREESRIRNEEYNRLRLIEEELKQRKQNELDNFKRLLLDANRWKKLNVLREYISHISSDPNVDKVMFNEEWLTWAIAKADWYDPTINKFDELLSWVDRNSI